MAILNISQILLKRGNTAAASNYVGPIGEVIIDTGLETIRVQDGATPGGWPLASGASTAQTNAVIANAILQLDGVHSNVANITANLDSVISTIGNIQQPNLYAITSNISTLQYNVYGNGTIGTSNIADVSGTGLGVNIVSNSYVRMQYDPTGVYNSGEIQNGSWAFIANGGIFFQSNVTGNTQSVTLTDQGQVIASGSIMAPIVVANVATANIIFSDNSIQTTAFTPAQIIAANTAMQNYVVSFVDQQINSLINSAPTTLDTLGQIAANLAADANSINTILSGQIATNAAIITANTAVVNYVNAQDAAIVASLQSQITGANISANSAVATLTNKTLVVGYGEPNTLYVKDTAIQSYAGSGGTILFNTSPTIISPFIASGSYLGFTSDGSQQTTAWLGNSAVSTYLAPTFTTINANITAANAAIATLQTQVYANANVASYLTKYNGVANVSQIQFGPGGPSIAASGAYVYSQYLQTTGLSSPSVSSGGNPLTLQANNNNLILDIYGNLTLPNALKFSDGSVQTTAYGNANVAAYLVANPQGSIYSNSNVTAYLAGNVSTGNLNIGSTLQIHTLDNSIETTNGSAITFNSRLNLYGSAVGIGLYVTNPVTFGTSLSVGTSSNAQSFYGTNYYWANGVSLLNGISGSYTNANVAAYLPTDPTITGIQSNVTAANSVIATHSTWLGNLQANVYSNANVVSYYTSANIINVGYPYTNLMANAYGVTLGNLGAVYSTMTGSSGVTRLTNNLGFWANGFSYVLTNQGYGQLQIGTGIATLSLNNTGTANTVSGGSTIWNASSTAFNIFQPMVFQSANISVNAVNNAFGITANLTITGSNTVMTGNVFAGNVSAAGFFYANGTPFTSSSYGNTQVAAYLPAYYGNIAANILTANNITSYGYVSTGAVYAATIGNTGATLTGTLSTATQPNITSVGTLSALTVSGATTTGNIITTNGIFWANGVAYSTGSGSGTTYSNANVTAYLTTATINTTGNITAGNLTTSGTYTVASIATTGTYGNITGANVISANTVTISNGIFWANGTAYSSGSGGGTQTSIANGTSSLTISSSGGNAVFQIGGVQTATFSQGSIAMIGNISATANITAAGIIATQYGNSAGTTATYSGLITAGNIVTTNGIFWANGVAYSTGSGGGGSYGNTQVAQYLPTDPTINTIEANIGSFYTWANINFGTNSYANGNVIAYLAATNGLGLADVVNVGNVMSGANTYPIPTTVPQFIMGNATLIGSMPGLPRATVIANNLYYDNTTQTWIRNTQTGATQISMYDGTINFNGVSGAVTANAKATIVSNWAQITSSGLSAPAITASAGALTTGIGYLVSSQSTSYLFDSTVTTLNSRSATTVNLGAAGANLYFGSNTGNIYAGNITANSHIFGDGTVQTSAYSNANVVSMLSANSAVFIGNTNLPNYLQSNITQLVIGGNTVITSGVSTNASSTYLMNNLYIDATGAQRIRNTTNQGAVLLEMTGGQFIFAGGGGSVTGNSVAGLGLIATLGTGGFTTLNSTNITAAGSLQTNSGQLLTNQSSTQIFPTNASSISIGAAATSITMGPTSVTVNIGTGVGNLIVGNVITGVYGAHYGNAVGSIASYSGNVTAANVIANIYGTQYGNTVGTTATYTGNITANYFLGNGAALSGLQYSSVGNIYGSSSNVTLVAGTYSSVFDNTGNLTVNGNVIATNFYGTNNISGNVVGTQPNVTIQAGTYTTVFDNTGNITLANVANAYINGSNTNGNIVINPIGSGNVIIDGNLAVPNGGITVGGIRLNPGFATVNAPASANQLLTAAYTDSWSQLNGGNITLPYGNSVMAGTTMNFSNHSSSSIYYVFVKDSNNEFIYNGSAPYTSTNRRLPLYPGESATLMSRGTVEWDIVSGPAGLSTGTWTPSLTASTTAPSVTYSSQTGNWTKNGNMIFVNGYINVSAISSQGSGTLQITGLPFTVLDEMVLFNFSATDALTNYYSTGNPGITQIYGHGGGGTLINFRGAGPGKSTTDLQCGSLTTGYILFSCYYRTNT
jgi:hypothetical protein